MSQLGLKIARKVASGPLGGDQEIGGMITTDEVAAAFFFIDPLSAHPHEADIRALTRICEVHNCATATNPITGEALVHAFLTNPTHINMLYKSSKRGESDVVAKYKEGQQAVISAVASAPAAAKASPEEVPKSAIPTEAAALSEGSQRAADVIARAAESVEPKRRLSKPAAGAA